MSDILRIGVIGGSGLYQMDGLTDIREEALQTPFGAPSAPCLIGRLEGLEGVELVFLPRHGRNHEFNPSEVNYRANIFGMKSLGVSWIISVSAVGSLEEAVVPGHVVIIDQFIASAEVKWQRYSGLVCLLPHGYEGQGPEHSSARLERFLTLCANDDMQVVQPTTPSQMFHVLRRQMRRNFRKPLIIMTPKILLRHPLAVSPVSDFVNERFHHLLDDTGVVDREAVTMLLLCSGKIYYELAERRDAIERRDIAIIRCEQLFPFRERSIELILEKYPNAAKFRWVQEEPKNMGA